MEEYINQILEYLPVEFADDEANEFIKYLKEAYLENIQNQKYQFAFSAFHMLYMVFIYKVKWFLKEQNNDSITTYLTNKRDQKFNTLFDLSQIKEKDTLENLLKALSFHVNEIGICKNHVEVRNNCLHSSGKIYYKTTKKIEYYIEEELEYIEKLQNKVKTELEKIFIEYLNENWEVPFLTGYLKSWIIQNHLSRKDLEIIINFDLGLFKEESNNEETLQKKKLYLVFINQVQENYLELEQNIVLEKLPMFKHGLRDVFIPKAGQNDEQENITQKIIDLFIVPIIDKFSEDDKKKAGEILQLETI